MADAASATSAVTGTIEQLILVNYRVDPQLLATFLPAPFRPAVDTGDTVACSMLAGNGAVTLDYDTISAPTCLTLGTPVA